MSDSDDRRDERAFDDPAHDEIRRLLADARVTDPIPADVSARLDATLASLREQAREEAGAPANVVPLRRRLGPALVAAAVIVVVGGGGVGIAQLAGSGTGGSADKAAGRSVAADEDGSGTTSGSAPQPADPESAPQVSGLAAKALPHLTTARFGQGVSRLMRTSYGTLDTRSPQPTTPQTDAPKALDNLAQGYLVPAAPPVTATPPSAATGDYLDRGALACAGPDVPDAVVWPASLDGALVALVFRPPTADAQVVEAWSCDGAALLASVTVPH
jgi:hypothetical protein